MKAIVIAALALMVAMPASAQMSSPQAGGNGPATETSNTAVDPSMMTCQQMMDNTQPKLMAMADGDQKSMMMHQVKMATDAMDMHHEKTCKKHMMKVMDVM